MNRLGFIGLALLVVGCEAAAASEGEPLQGVVEYEDRVLAFEVGGRVLSLGIERGSEVDSGATLVTLDDGLERPVRDARLAEVAAARAQLRLVELGARPEEVRGAEAELRALRAQEELAERMRTRQTGLVERGVAAPVSLEDLDGQITTLSGRREALEARIRGLRRGARAEEIDAAEARVSAAVAALSAVEARLSRYVLRSVAAGDVVDVHVLPGEVVAPGAPAVTLADLDHPFVDVFVPEGRMAGIRVGATARVRVDGVGSPLRARVEHVFHRTEFTPRFLFSERERPNLVLRVRIRIEDPEHRVHSGLPAFVTLDGHEGSGR